jgi:hypothetical protein
MAKYISPEKIFESVTDIIQDCCKNKLTISQQLDYTNGENTAIMNYTLYSRNPELYWSIQKSPCNLNNINREVSDIYILAYNKKAKELGLPPYNLIDYITLLTSLIIFYKIISTKT